jgi:hypothetical protein
MKKSTLLSVLVMILSLVAASAFAQTEEPSQAQNQAKNQAQSQTQSQTQAQTQAKAQVQAQSQEAGAVQAQTQQQAQVSEQVQAQNANQFQTQAGVTEDDSDKSMDQVQYKKMLQLRKLNYADANGVDANGGIHRNGADFVGEPGPHGYPRMQGENDAEELEKFLGIDEMFVTGDPSMNMSRAGSVNSYNAEAMLGRSLGPWGPMQGVEDPAPYGHLGDFDAAFGPQPDAAFGMGGDVHFGPGGSDDDTGGSGEASPSGTLSGLRQGRR